VPDAGRRKAEERESEIWIKRKEKEKER